MSSVFYTSQPFTPFDRSDFDFSSPSCYLRKEKNLRKVWQAKEMHVNVKLCSQMDSCSELSFY